jgi:hypothetical protein
MTGDTFRPALLTTATIERMTRFAGNPAYDTRPIPPEPLLENPSPPYPLDPHRGVETQDNADTNNTDANTDAVIVAVLRTIWIKLHSRSRNCHLKVRTAQRTG